MTYSTLHLRLSIVLRAFQNWRQLLQYSVAIAIACSILRSNRQAFCHCDRQRELRIENKR